MSLIFNTYSMFYCPSCPWADSDSVCSLGSRLPVGPYCHLARLNIFERYAFIPRLGWSRRGLLRLYVFDPSVIYGAAEDYCY